MSRRPPRDPSTYVVGYAKPPEATRFSPGKSANPRGRPKGSRPLGAILSDLIHERVEVSEKGQTRRVSAIELMFRRLRNDAIRGDAKALKLLMAFNERYGGSPESVTDLTAMQAEDLAILAAYTRNSPDSGVETADPDPKPESGMRKSGHEVENPDGN